MVQVDSKSFEMTIIALGDATTTYQEAAAVGIQAAGAVLLDRTRRHVSRRDHSLADLRRMDHPYARRHGVIQAGRLGGAFVRRPYLVHTRSGTMLRALQGRRRNSFTYDVSFREIAPWISYVVQGTRKMIGRDVIWLTAHERETKVEMMRAIIRVFGSGLRLKAAVRFGGMS